MKAIITLLLLLFTPIALAVKVQVIGLFPHKAVVLVDGKQYVLDINESTPEGVTLRKASSDTAWLEVDNTVQAYKISHSTGYKISKPVDQTVMISPNEKGMYEIGGSINNRAVIFIVDTGASHIAMSSQMADKLNIEYKKNSQPMMVETANAKIPAHQVILDNVKVGDIVLYDVTALVIEGPRPYRILLGMSFLNRVKINNKGSLLLLRQKY